MGSSLPVESCADQAGEVVFACHQFPCLNSETEHSLIRSENLKSGPLSTNQKTAEVAFHADTEPSFLRGTRMHLTQTKGRGIILINISF